METSFRELKCKDVINIIDGRNLGHTCDIVFTYPDGKVHGIVVPGKRGFCPFRKNDLFISLRNVIKIGADAVLVELKNTRPDPHCGKKRESYICDTFGETPNENAGRRDYAEYE